MTPLALVFGIATAHAEPVDVHADQVDVQDGIATATGNVVLEMGDQRAVAERGRLEIATGQLHLESGTWYRSDGALAFEEADVDLGDLTGVALDARLTNGRRVLTADRIELGPGRTAVAEGVTYTTCECANPTWEITARRVRVTLDGTATFVGGVVRICGVPLLPFPVGRLALTDRRSGFLMPRVGLGEDGLLLAEPFYLTLGPSADTTITPEWRSDRGLRGIGEFRYALDPDEGGTLGGFLGRDDRLTAPLRDREIPVEDRWRGAIASDHGWAPGPFRSAVRGQWISDPGVLADYSDSYLARASPWTEVQGTVGVGPFRAESDTFQVGYAYDDEILGERFEGRTETTERPIGGALSLPAIRMGPVVGALLARTDLLAPGLGIDEIAPDGEVRTQAGAALTAGHEVGAFRFTGDVRGSAIAYDDGDPWEMGTAGASAVVSLWRDYGSLRHLLDVGVTGSLGAHDGAPDVRMIEDEPPPATAIGPALDSTWLSSGGIPLHVRLGLPWIDGRPEPFGSVRLVLGRWSSTITADRTLQEGDVGISDASGRLVVGVARTDVLLQARGGFERDVPGVAWLRVGYGGLFDVEELYAPADPLNEHPLLWHGPSIRYKSPCKCLEAGISAVWAVDKTVPDVRLQLEVL